MHQKWLREKEINRMKQKEHWLLHQQRESSSVFLYSRNPSPEAWFLSTVRLKIVFRKFVEMSQARVFTLLGESNVRSYITKTSVRANPLMKSAQVLPCGNLSIFTAMLEKVRLESTACIVSCITNLLTDVDGPPTLSLRVNPVLQVGALNIITLSCVLSSSCVPRVSI